MDGEEVHIIIFSSQLELFRDDSGQCREVSGLIIIIIISTS